MICPLDEAEDIVNDFELAAPDDKRDDSKPIICIHKSIKVYGEDE